MVSSENSAPGPEDLTGGVCFVGMLFGVCEVCFAGRPQGMLRVSVSACLHLYVDMFRLGCMNIIEYIHVLIYILECH